MRILAITNLFPNPYHPGRATFNRQQFAALRVAHEVQVISPISWTAEAKARLGGARRLPRGRRVELDGLQIDHPRYYYTPKFGRGWYGQWFRRSVRNTFLRAIDEFRPQVVFAPWIYPDGWAAVRLGKAFQIPVVLKAHGSDVLCLDSGSTRGRTVEALLGADAVVAVSRHLAEAISNLGVPAGRIHVVADGIDTGRFKPQPRSLALAQLGLPEDPPLMLFVGNLEPVKGVDVLIAACAQLKRQGASFICRLVGDGSLGSKLRKTIEREGLGGHVALVGRRPHGELATWFNAASVVVLPSRSEGLPCVLLEASACGTPFVGSRVGGIPEIAALGANWLSPPQDPVRLSLALREAIRWSGEHPVRTARYTRTHADAAQDLTAIFRGILSSGRAGGSEPNAAQQRQQPLAR